MSVHNKEGNRSRICEYDCGGKLEFIYFFDHVLRVSGDKRCSSLCIDSFIFAVSDHQAPNNPRTFMLCKMKKFYIQMMIIS